MATNVRQLFYDRLRGDQTLYPGLVPGGIYIKPIRPSPRQGATTAAFAIIPGDPTKRLRLQHAIVVYGGDEVPATDNHETLGAWEAFPRVTYYVEASDKGRAAFDVIDARVRYTLHKSRWNPALDGNIPVFLTVLNKTEPIESDELDNVLVGFRRFRAEYLRPGG